MLSKSSVSVPRHGPANDEADGIRWAQIAQRLLAADTSQRKTTSFSWKEPEAPAEVFVQVLERQTQSTVLVLWRGAARCNYGEQVWIRGVAKRTGICALSGRPVVRGDRIYYPRHSKGRLSNALAMILAASIEAAGTSPD